MESPPAPPVDDPRELTNAMVALQCRTGPVPLSGAKDVSEPPPRTSSKSHSNRRALLALGLFVLGLAGVLQLATTTPDTRSGPNDGSRANVVFSNALSGTCLNWPADAPDKPSFVQCTDDHMFEVARPVGMKSFMEPCQLAVSDYLGPHFDPNSRFASTVLWAGDDQASRTDERNMLCGLQLPGPDGRPIPFKGMVAQQDQSRVWPAGTCLGIDTQTGHSTQKQVQCSAAHAAEVTGIVNVGERFPNGRPSEPDQDRFIQDACHRLTSEYLAPVPLNVTGLSVNYPIVAPASWTAGSRQVPCTIGIRRSDDSWVSLLGSARAGVLIDGQAPTSPEEATVAPPPLAETSTVASTSAPVTTTAAVPAATPTAVTPTTTSAAASPSTSAAPSTSGSASSSVAAPPGPAPGLEPTPTTTELPSNMIDTPFGPIVLPWLPTPEPTE